VPRAAEVVLPLEDHEVVEAEPLQLDRRTDAAEARPDDRGVVHGDWHEGSRTVQIIGLSGY
jgi:hypothetical protein